MMMMMMMMQNEYLLGCHMSSLHSMVMMHGISPPPALETDPDICVVLFMCQKRSMPSGTWNILI